MPKRVREPIQVYLTERERAHLDRVAAAMGVSRSEALRRGVAALDPTGAAAGPLADLVTRGLATPARVEGSAPPVGKPVTRLCELLRELQSDREDR